jgi:hypothetical protein
VLVELNATSAGALPTVMVATGVFVVGSITVTVLLALLVTYTLAPLGMSLTLLGPGPVGILVRMVPLSELRTAMELSAGLAT